LYRVSLCTLAPVVASSAASIVRMKGSHKVWPQPDSRAYEEGRVWHTARSRPGRDDIVTPVSVAAPCKMMKGGCFVVKSGSRIPDGEPLTFVVCCDEIPYAQKVVFDAQRFCRPWIDKIAVLYCSAGTVAIRSAIAVGAHINDCPSLTLMRLTKRALKCS
jgi:hypothetical protein